MAALTGKRSNERKKLLEVWFKSLPQCQQDDIMAIAETLVDEIQARPVASGAGKFGIASALEVIWAVGRYLNEPLARRLGEEHGTFTG